MTVETELWPSGTFCGVQDACSSSVPCICSEFVKCFPAKFKLIGWVELLIVPHDCSTAWSPTVQCGCRWCLGGNVLQIPHRLGVWGRGWMSELPCSIVKEPIVSKGPYWGAPAWAQWGGALLWTGRSAKKQGCEMSACPWDRLLHTFTCPEKIHLPQCAT